METKWCVGWSKGNCKPHNSPISNFTKYAKAIDGLQPMCRDCKSKYNTSARKQHWNSKRYGKDSLDKYRSSYSIAGARSRAERLLRYPPWISKQQEEQIKAIYNLRDKLNKCHAKAYWHVDHIIPLVGKEISGLHIPENLQIIPAKDNLKKGASYEASIRH